jgi:type III secretory pathway lipoprotein EscJ
MSRNMLIRLTAVALIALSGVAAVLASFMKTEDANEMAALLAAKTTLARAIPAAEQDTGVCAMMVDAEHEKRSYVY